MNGTERFDYYLNKVQDLLNKSASEADPGWWLFTHDFRTQMFMLEALAKLYSKLHDKDLFNKLQDSFKELEDIMGDIDYYNAYENEFKTGDNTKPELIQYFREQKDKNLKSLNKILLENKWLGNGNGRVEKIRTKLTEVSWLPEQEEMVEIKKFYHKTVESINEFYHSITLPFDDMEEHVHEIRRKLRWLSIFPQALRGSIQLSDKVAPTGALAKYLVPDIVNSPFNKLPAPTGCRYVLLLEKNYFLALSWTIAELGKIKDAGLGIIALEEASKRLRDDSDTSKSNTSAQAANPALADFLNRASVITKTFFEEGNLDKLVGEVVEVMPVAGENS